MSLTETRQPTLAEAVAFVMQSLTVEYRRECIAHWRLEYGDEYADAVAREVRARWEAKRGV